MKNIPIELTEILEELEKEGNLYWNLNQNKVIDVVINNMEDIDEQGNIIYKDYNVEELYEFINLHGEILHNNLLIYKDYYLLISYSSNEL